LNAHNIRALPPHCEKNIQKGAVWSHVCIMHGKFLFGRLVRANYYSKKRGIEYVLQNTISLVFRLEMVERSGLNTNAGA